MIRLTVNAGFSVLLVFTLTSINYLESQAGIVSMGAGVQVAAQVSEDTREYLRKEAFERSEPGDRVTMSDLVRQGLEETYGIDVSPS